MAKPWAEVKQSDAFKALSSNDQEDARNEYFQQVVAPQVPTADLATVRGQFDADTAPTVSNWVRDKYSSLTAPDAPTPAGSPPKEGLMDQIGSAMNSYRDNSIAAGNILTGRATVPDVPKPERSWGSAIADTGLDLAKGTVGVGESAVGLADMALFNLPGKSLGAIGYDPQESRKILSGFQSAERQAAGAEVHKAKGFAGTLLAL